MHSDNIQRSIFCVIPSGVRICAKEFLCFIQNCSNS